jgi:hypothetical protein
LDSGGTVVALFWAKEEQYPIISPVGHQDKTITVVAGPARLAALGPLIWVLFAVIDELVELSESVSQQRRPSAVWTPDDCDIFFGGYS